MKKGSKLTKCAICGDPIFWTVPEDDVLGLQFVTIKPLQKWAYCKTGRTNIKCCSKCADGMNNAAV